MDTEPKLSLTPQQESEKRDREIRASMSRLLQKFPNKAVEIYNEIVLHGKKLQEKYPACSEHALFHTLALSTLDPKKVYRYDDFPGEDSVVKFIDSLLKKYD